MKEEDLGVKIGTPEEAFWTQTKKQSLDSIDNAKRGIIINEELIRLCDRMISQEKSKKEA